MSDMEKRILSLAKFVMSYQKAYVEHAFGSDYKVTWDANLLHHVVGPITKAVYKSHSDYSPLLCSLPTDDELQHAQKDVYLPYQEQMQVLTIFCSNYDTKTERCTKITYRYEDDGSIIGSAYIPSRGIHIQGPGSQSPGILHETTIHCDAKKSGIYRCLCTTRLTITPKHGTAFEKRIRLENVPSEKDFDDSNNRQVRDKESHDITSVVSLSSATGGNDVLNNRKERKRHVIQPSEKHSSHEIDNDSVQNVNSFRKKNVLSLPVPFSLMIELKEKKSTNIPQFHQKKST
jgi:hypothetical protein